MKNKILVIEDETQTREFFLDCLQAEGFDTVGAENGLVGIRWAKEYLPDLIICDITMPQIDGYSVLTTLRQNPFTSVIPFILIAAQIVWPDFRKGMELGADDYLTKPCKENELLKAIAAQLKKQTAHWERYNAQSNLPLESVSIDFATLATVDVNFKYNPILTEIFQFIKVNYHKSIGLNEVAQALNYSPSYLTGLVRRKTGQTINHWIIKHRMAAAQSLLIKSNLSVNQIAEAVGYQNVGHFFRQFRQHHDLTPQHWREVQITVEKENTNGSKS
jgi:YesN/AraC family two-component response regulator